MRRCQDYLAEIGSHPIGRAEILLNLAGLYAMRDDFAAAQETLGNAKSLLETLGPTMTAVITQPAALIAMLAGDPATAERYLRLEFDSLYQVGERRFLATTAATLARAIAAHGPDRYGEALELIAVSRECAAEDDLSAQTIGGSLHARILADQGGTGKPGNSPARRPAWPRSPTCSTSTPTPCSNSPMSWPRRARWPKHTPPPPEHLASISAKATCPAPGSRSAASTRSHPPEGMLLMPHPYVDSVTLTNNQVTLRVEVSDFGPSGGYVEVSGQASQVGGALAIIFQTVAVPSAANGEGEDGGRWFVDITANTDGQNPFRKDQNVSVFVRVARPGLRYLARIPLRPWRPATMKLSPGIAWDLVRADARYDGSETRRRRSVMTGLYHGTWWDWHGSQSLDELMNGRFIKLFPDLPPAAFAEEDLLKLAERMTRAGAEAYPGVQA